MAVLGVSRSLNGREWRQRPGDERIGLAISQGFGLSDLLGRLMAARDIGFAEAGVFLEPGLRSQLPDPGRLLDMEKAADRLAAAVRENEPVAVFGDYDVDGATAAALLAHVLGALGTPPRIYIPDRLTEGYGPNLAAFSRLRAEGIRLVVTVDCGILAFDTLAGAAAMGMETIVVDHHTAAPDLPVAHAVVNPNRLDEAPGFGHLAAVGVCFLLAVALRRTLRRSGYFRSRPEPDLRQWLDIVALGTVCDIVPLTGLNRAFVTQGLRVMAKQGNVGLAALASLCRLEEAPTAWHLGYVLGPRINAGGRVGEAGLGAQLLTSRDRRAAREIASRLDGYNRERREIEAQVLAEALARIETGPVPPDPVPPDPVPPDPVPPGSVPPGPVMAPGPVVVAGAGWHPGVIGIVAARLRERCGRPAVVVAMQGDHGKGSARSVPGFDIGAAVIAACQAGLLEAGGGHAMAAGLTVAADRVAPFRAFLAERFAASGLADPGLNPGLTIDAVLSPGAPGERLLADLARLAPFGPGNPEPRFALDGARVTWAARAGERHVRCNLAGATGGRLAAIAFNSLGTPLGPALLTAGGRPVKLAGRVRANRWQGRTTPQFVIEDGART